MIVRTARNGNLELRTGDGFGLASSYIPPYGLGWVASAGLPVTQDMAYGLPAVASVIRQPATLIATLPFLTYKPGPEGVPVEALDAWQYLLLKETPSPESDSFQFFYDVAISLEATQNAFVHKVKGAKKVFELRVMDPQKMRVLRDRDSGIRSYEYWTPGGVVPLANDEVLHVRGFTPHPGDMLGVSYIQAHRDAIGNAAAMQRFEGDYFRNGAQSPLVVTGSANQQQAQDNADLWNAQHQGAGNQWKPAFLHGALDVKPIPLSNSDAQFVESKRLTVEDACRIWHWPHHLMEISGEQPLRNEDMWTALFMKIYVNWRLRRIEKAFAADPDLFSGQVLFGQFVTDEIERADFSVRMTAYKDAVQAGVFTPNECREYEKKPPKPNGDDLQFPVVGGGAIHGAEPAANGSQNGNGAGRSLEKLLAQ